MFDSLNQLKKHLDAKHKRQYCDICLNNRKCIHSEQILYSDAEYQRHIKKGEFTENGDLILYHPTCQFCKQTFYDIDEFKRHLEMVHQKCFICHKNSDLKYIYFKDYQQATQHFKKSHFYCQTGNCLTTKFENVFVTEDALNEHVARVHKKTKKNIQPIMNIALGFNSTEKDQVFQWDKVGKNFVTVFQTAQKHSTSLRLQPVNHQNICIDIRDFYLEQSKKTLNLSLIKIKERIQDKLYDLKYNEKELFIDDVDFFRPLDMQPCTKVDLQKFLASIFQPKTSSQIINKFFHGRQDFKSMDQYFGFVKQKMKSYSKIAFYYAFPQLVRFFKNQNPHKQAMDEYYYESLRELKVKKQFIIHAKTKYSEILFYMKELIEKQIQQRDYDTKNQSKQLNITKYLNFIKDLNITYYVQNQQDIFYVSKQKITNLYFMINKCKVKDFLKMNWLLKVGFNNQAYKIIYKEFYYREQAQCPNAMKKFTIQQLAYLYSYCNICLEAIFQKDNFKRNKQKPSPLFLSEVLQRIKRSNTHQKLKQIIQSENKSLRIDIIIRQNINKGVIINKQDHPSLLDLNVDAPYKTKPPDKIQDFPSVVAFGTKRPKIWNQTINNSIAKGPVKNQQEYPSILSDSRKQKKWQKKQVEEDFPIYHYVGKKDKKSKGLNQATSQKVNLHEAIGWQSSNFVPNKWSQQISLKDWQKRQQDQKRRRFRQEQIERQKNNKNDKLSQNFLKKTKIIDNYVVSNPANKLFVNEQNKLKKQPEKKIEEPMMIIKSKKDNKVNDQQVKFNETKKKNKKNKKKQQEEIETQGIQQHNKQKIQSKAQKRTSQQQCGLFQKIQKQSELVAKKAKANDKKLKQFFQASKALNGIKNEQKQRIPSKSAYIHSYETFSKDDFPELEKPKNNQKNATVKVKNEQQNDKFKKSKKLKIRFDDTDSDQQELRKKQKIQHKKSQQFVSIADRFEKKAQQKLSKVNQIIQTANIQQKPENKIKVKKGRNGKNTIVQRVNLWQL